jgi:hypothetical protein
MNESRTVPAVSLSSGASIDVAKSHQNLTSHTCCVGQDVPGVGWQHTPGCPAAVCPICQAPLDAAGFCSGNTLNFGTSSGQIFDDQGEARKFYACRNDSLFWDLLRAAQALALTNICAGNGVAICHECYAVGDSAGPVLHAITCNTGKVLSLVTAITNMAVAQPSIPQREETAPAGEDDHSGTGMGLRGLQERVCLKCGKRGGLWTAELKPEAEVWVADLALNQCVGMAADGHGHILYTHLCQVDSARQGGAL